jgi:hypothetical protein
MIHRRRGLERRIDGAEVMQAVADTDNTGNLGLLGFLDYAELFDRIIIDKPYVSVSIKKLHG